MGAAGRDFHNFNLVYRDDPGCEVVAFTAAQIPDIDGRRYPPELAGKLYPQGISIEPEESLPELIEKHGVDDVVFAYSDVSHEYVMHRASLANAAGANFLLIGRRQTMIRSSKPVVSICAGRTGSGKSQTTRKVVQILKEMKKTPVVVRHPMPYGNLTAQRLQRFAEYRDLEKHECTVEEMEEYEPHISSGTIVYAGIDYEAILREAETEADVVVWDGGNNDTSFFKPDLQIVVVDPHRPGHELTYYPGETNVRVADVIVINKQASASLADIETVRANIRRVNARAQIVDAASPLFTDAPSLINGKRVLVVEDGPTLTHGEMKYGAGVVAARKFGAREIVDPRPWIVGTIAETFEKYPFIGTLLPAMGYGQEQIQDLETTINNADCDAVVVATPVDLKRILNITKPSTRVRYELQEIGGPTLSDVLAIMA